MDYFNKIPNEDGEIILKLKDNFTIEILENNTFKIKNKVITINNKEKIKDYDFTFSEIFNCKINNQIIDIRKYKKLITHIYNLINDGSKIIKNSILNTSTKYIQDKGFTYIKNIGISYQNVDAGKAIKEICNQCIINKIKLDLNIKLQDRIILNIVL